jgi:hypothetical protein
MSQRTPLKTIRMTIVLLFVDNMAVVLDFLALQDKHNIHCMYIVSKCQINSLQNSPEKLAFLPVFKACTNKLYIFQECTCTYILYTCI